MLLCEKEEFLYLVLLILKEEKMVNKQEKLEVWFRESLKQGFTKGFRKSKKS